MSAARRLGVGAILIGGLLLAGLVALIAWGGIRIVPGDAPGAAGPVRVEGASLRVAAPEAVNLTIPVAGVARGAIQDSWGDARDGGTRAHQGTDIMAPRGTPVVAAAAGTIEKLFQSEAGGITLYVRSPQRRVTYYYAHLAGYAPGVREGLSVRPGDPLGYVGDTGNAGAGNYHLHFGVALTSPGQRWHEGTAIDPYPLLAGKAARR